MNQKTHLPSQCYNNSVKTGSLLSFQSFAPKHVATGEAVKVVPVDSKLNKNVRLTNVTFDP